MDTSIKQEVKEEDTKVKMENGESNVEQSAEKPRKPRRVESVRPSNDTAGNYANYQAFQIQGYRKVTNAFIKRLSIAVYNRDPPKHQNAVQEYGLHDKAHANRFPLGSLMNEMEFSDLSTIIIRAFLDVLDHIQTNVELDSSRLKRDQDSLVQLVSRYEQLLGLVEISELEQEKIRVAIFKSLLREAYGLEVKTMESKTNHSKFGRPTVWSGYENIILGMAVALLPDCQALADCLCERSVPSISGRLSRFMKGMSSLQPDNFLKQAFISLKALTKRDLLATYGQIYSLTNATSRLHAKQHQMETHQKQAAFANDRGGMDDDSEDFGRFRQFRP